MKDPADYTEYSHSLLLKLALGDKTREIQTCHLILTLSVYFYNKGTYYSTSDESS